MKVAKIDLTGRTLEQVLEGIAPEKIACCNWEAEFPYAPNVTFKMFHTGEKLYVRFDVEEGYTAARVAEIMARFGPTHVASSSWHSMMKHITTSKLPASAKC